MTVYLLHFARPIGNLANPRAQARHYIGWTKPDMLDQRLQAHASGKGAHIMVAANVVGWVLARTWDGDRKLEHALKRRKNAAQLCPVCRGAHSR